MDPGFLYSQYLMYSGGIHPTYDQYNYFVNNYFLRQQPYIPQMYNLPPHFIPITNHQPVKQNRHNCELNMTCKDAYCLNFHHPGIVNK